MSQPFDAVLLIAFGGPHGPDEVRPFLANVLRGRRVPAERVEEVARHYELFGGVSPLTALTRRQADGLRDTLRERGMPLPVYVGMRNWHPFLKDTLTAMSRDGVRRAIGFIAAAHRSYSSCTQYRENVDAARAEITRAGHADVEVSYVGDWHTSRGFIDANADHIAEARSRLPPEVRDRARVIFTAHSIPLSMADKYPYREQLEESARLVMDGVARSFSSAVAAEAKLRPTNGDYRTNADYALVYQSRSGRSDDPWLEPDVCDYLRREASRGLEAAIVCPLGFICDHIEVLYDLDVEAAAVCREIGLPMVRARAVNDHPRFLDAMADAVIERCRRYSHARPLQVVART